MLWNVSAFSKVTYFQLPRNASLELLLEQSTVERSKQCLKSMRSLQKTPGGSSV